MKCPCYDELTKTDCPRRKAGCAINCPEWAEYVEARNKAYEENIRAGDVDAVLTTLDFKRELRRRKYRRPIRLNGRRK